MKPLQNFRVYRQVDGQWLFNARAKSAKQMIHTVWWLNKNTINKNQIKVEPNKSVTKKEGK